jgi:hypothetical protein
MSDVSHRFVEATGIRIHVAEQGKGPLVALCHGFPESWYSPGGLRSSGTATSPRRKYQQRDQFMKNALASCGMAMGLLALAAQTAPRVVQMI